MVRRIRRGMVTLMSPFHVGHINDWYRILFLLRCPKTLGDHVSMCSLFSAAPVLLPSSLTLPTAIPPATSVISSKVEENTIFPSLDVTVSFAKVDQTEIKMDGLSSYRVVPLT